VRIIGVIDLKDGLAVHARGGRRDDYAPVNAAAGVSIDGNPVALAHMYIETFGLDTIYVADLNAIAGDAPHDEAIRRLGALGASLMVDAGIRGAGDGHRLAVAGAGTTVVGLETLQSFDALSEMRRGRSTIAFSLDLRQGIPISGGAAKRGQSPEAIAAQAAGAGVDTIIVLDVARVGGNTGPDLSMLRRIGEAVPDIRVVAAGGVRDGDDLRALAAIGCDGVLVASALHDGRLTPADIRAVRDTQPSDRSSLRPPSRSR